MSRLKSARPQMWLLYLYSISEVPCSTVEAARLLSQWETRKPLEMYSSASRHLLRVSLASARLQEPLPGRHLAVSSMLRNPFVAGALAGICEERGSFYDSVHTCAFTKFFFRRTKHFKHH